MDEFGLYPREEPFDPLGVMLFKALQVIALLFFIARLVKGIFTKQHRRCPLRVISGDCR